MNSRIIGNEDMLKRAKSAQPGDKTTLINFELINELPDEFEPMLVTVTFKFPDDFSKVGNDAYIPTADLMYRIAEAKGISSYGDSIVEPVYQDVDWSLLTLDDQPNIQRIKVGYSVTKRSCVMQEDGTSRISSPCTIEYNAWDYCVALWMNEEKYTEGYTKNNDKAKYNSKYARKAHFYGEQGIKFAQRKAETKAYLKTIRELASMTTGYKSSDLASKSFMFIKIRRSSSVLKMETAARLAALSSGAEYKAPELFGEQPSRQIEAPSQDIIQQPEPEQTTPIDIKLLEVFSYYKKNDVIPPEQLDGINAVIKWLEDENQDHTNERFLEKAIEKLKELEETIPEMMKMEYDI